MTFEDLDLIEPIRKALVQEGYTTPTPIQSEAIPIVSQGYDLLGCAQTGTGKTAAFSIPIIQRLYLQKKKGYKRGIKALILTPTRELAIQIGESFAAYGRFAGLRHTVIFGVFIVGLPKQDKSPYPISSQLITMILGFVG